MMAMKAVTIAAVIAELIETHMEKCDEASDDNPNDDPMPHIITEAHGSANITQVSNAPMDDGEHLIRLELDDGTAFVITVEEA
mgnify:CR=1 FL=1